MMIIKSRTKFFYSRRELWTRNKKPCLREKSASARLRKREKEPQRDLSLVKKTMIAGSTTSLPMKRTGRSPRTSTKIGRKHRKKKLITEGVDPTSHELIGNAGDFLSN